MPPKSRPARKPTSSFPAAWVWLVDDLIPNFVKEYYSPRESWKGKPFAKEDALFFFKGIDELSSLFTDERPSQLPAYFSHPKYRSGYLLYFLPLQAAKFLTVFQLHSGAFEAALEDGRKKGVLRIADLGAGPGTASLSFLLALLDVHQKNREPLPPVEIYCVDTNGSILEDGKKLLLDLANQFPALRGKVTVHNRVDPWWKAVHALPELSLVLMGNVLNEAALPRALTEKGTGASIWAELISKAQGGGILLLEPALRRSSQLLSSLRDELIESETVESSPKSIWGPCLHAGKCPLAGGRDWCHFSVPVEIPGKWFAQFSKGLGSERQWVKFSYLWFASEAYPAPVPNRDLRRVVSDPLKQGREGDVVLICEPEVAGRMTFRPSLHVRRGSMISVK